MVINLNDFFQKENIFVIIGATNNQEKYGSKVFLDLRDAGYNVVAINKNHQEVHRTPAYLSLSKFLDRIEHFFNEEMKTKTLNKIVIVSVVPPEHALKIVEEAHLHNVTKVWFQPGAESQEAISFCQEHRIEVIYGQCIMVQKP